MDRFILSIAFIILFGVFSVSRVLGQEVTPTATPSATAEYQLPYPGILPDNPLYFLKAFRDRIIEILIADPLKKSEFYLLAADKRVASGMSLLAKNKDELALDTISKGENYFEKALGKIVIAKSKGQDIGPLIQRLSLSAKKHQEVLAEIKGRIRETLRERVQRELDRAQVFEKHANDLGQY